MDTERVMYESGQAGGLGVFRETQNRGAGAQPCQNYFPGSWEGVNGQFSG